MKVIIGVFVVVLFLAGTAVACQFDTDCAPGSR